MDLNRTGDTLVHDVDHQLVNSAPIQDQLAKLNANYKEVLDRLEQEQIKLDAMIANAEEFQDVVLEFESWLPSVTSAVQQFEPVASEPVEIKKQLTEAEVSHFCIGFLKRIEMTNLLSIWKAVFVCLFV